MAEIHSVEGLAQYAQEQVERIERMQRELAEQTGEGTSRQGHVIARTGVAGSLRDLRIDPGAQRLPLGELTAEIMSAIGAAQADYARRADDIMEPILKVRPSEESAATYESRMSRLEALSDDLDRVARSRGLMD